MGVDQEQSLHNSETQLPNANAKVEDLVPVTAPVLIPIFRPLGLLRYPTKPISMAVQVATVSICTYLQGSPPTDYEYAVRELLSSEVAQTYSTAEEIMMGVIRDCTRSSVLHRKYGPVNWYNSPLDLDGKLFIFPWQIEVLGKITTASSRACPNSRSNFTFKFIQDPNR